jgi:hypothetical protein
VAKWFIENRNHCHHSQAWPYRHHNEAKMNNKKSRSANKSKKKKGHQKKKNVINQSIGGT